MLEVISRNLFATALIVLDLGAAIEAAVIGDLWQVGYWISAAVLTVCVIGGR